VGTHWYDFPVKDDCVFGTRLASNGYARTSNADGRRLAHRVAWEEKYGPIPGGMHVHHTCGNRACINVAHLELVTPAGHRIKHRKCEHGDEHRYVDRRGCSYCRICTQKRVRQRYQNDPVYRAKRQAEMRDYAARRRNGE
jgi:hypothetical protein